MLPPPPEMKRPQQAGTRLPQGPYPGSDSLGFPRSVHFQTAVATGESSDVEDACNAQLRDSKRVCIEGNWRSHPIFHELFKDPCILSRHFCEVSKMVSFFCLSFAKVHFADIFLLRDVHEVGKSLEGAALAFLA